MEIFRRLKEKYPSKFILASIMGKDEAEWESLSRLCEENGSDALEFILLGAGSIQVTTAIMQYGYRIIDDLKAGLNYYLAEKALDNINALRGLSLRKSP